MTRRLAFAAALCALLVGAEPAYATENGNQEYPLGVDTVLPAVMPAPGTTQYYDYFQYYDASSFIGTSGKKSVSDFHLNVVVNAFRFLHTWNLGSNGPWTLSSGLVLPLVDSSGHIAGQWGQDFTLGDLDLQPLYLGYHNKTGTLFIYGGPDVYVPTGHYNADDPVNAGLNYYTVKPTAGITWMPTARSAFSSEISYEVSTTNPATHYHSGDNITVDWVGEYAALRTVPNLFFGLQGYAFQQVTDDTVDGSVYEDGYRGRVLAIGPQIRWAFPGGGVALKFQHEFDVQNRAKGDSIWLQISFPIAQ